MNECPAKKSAYDVNLEYIRRYRAGDKKAGEELFLLNRPLIFRIAGKFSGRGVDTDELIECGTVGLVKAMNTFDFSRDCAFSTYAVPLIFGEIRRFLRDDGILKVSREDKKLCAILTSLRDRAAAEGREPTLSELAAEAGVSPEDAAAALGAGGGVRSLDEAAYGEEDGVSVGAGIFDEDAQERDFDRLCLRSALEKLPPKWAKIIYLRYYRDCSQAKTAEILSLSQVKVSREEKKILLFLRSQMGPED